MSEGGLISHNEILRRSSSNNDIEKSRTTHNIQHKDVYFTRGFNQHPYGNFNDLNDMVLFVNSLNNFALSGYGIPLNLTMQNDGNIGNGSFLYDGTGFSIISKNALSKNMYSYSKVDIKDLFIFISENKKAIIESNPYKYPIANAHIIYIPKEYYKPNGKYTYEIYEFIEQQMEQFKQTKNIIPNKIVENNVDEIFSCGNDYLWAFCNEIGNDNTEINIPNLLWNGSIDCILDVLRYCTLEKDNGFIDKIKKNMENVNFENISIPKCFPIELFKLLYCYLKIEKSHELNFFYLGKILSKSGYSQKGIAIFCNIFYYYHENRNSGLDKVDYFKKFCDSFNLSYNDELKNILSQLEGLM